MVIEITKFLKTNIIIFHSLPTFLCGNGLQIFEPYSRESIARSPLLGKLLTVSFGFLREKFAAGIKFNHT